MWTTFDYHLYIVVQELNGEWPARSADPGRKARPCAKSGSGEVGKGENAQKEALMHSTRAKLPEKPHGFRLKKGRQKRLQAISPLKVATPLPFFAGDKDDTFFWGLLDPATRSRSQRHPRSQKIAQGLLTFALYSPSVGVCANAGHARFVFSLGPSLAATRATSSSALVLEWNRALRDKFVQPGCTVTANRIPSPALIAWPCSRYWELHSACTGAGYPQWRGHATASRSDFLTRERGTTW